jgi:transcriptional regulator with XRE-family HTH domain
MDTIATKHSAEYKPGQMITGRQIRAARALLGWTTTALAESSGVHYATLSRAEQIDGVPNMRAQTLASVQQALEKAGCQFIDGPYSGDGGPGVRLR